MEKKMEPIIICLVGTTIRIHSFIPSFLAKRVTDVVITVTF